MKKYIWIVLLSAFLAVSSQAAMIIGMPGGGGCQSGSEFLKPNADGGTTEWTTGGTCPGGHYDCVDQCTDYTCSSPDTSNYLHTNYGGVLTDILGLTDPSSQCDNATQILVKVYASDDGCNACADEFIVKLNIDGQLETPSEGAIDITGCASWAWYTFTFSGSGKTWSQTDVAAATIQLISGECEWSSDPMIAEVAAQVSW